MHPIAPQAGAPQAAPSGAAGAPIDMTLALTGPSADGLSAQQRAQLVAALAQELPGVSARLVSPGGLLGFRVLRKRLCGHAWLAGSARCWWPRSRRSCPASVRAPFPLEGC